LETECNQKAFNKRTFKKNSVSWKQRKEKRQNNAPCEIGPGEIINRRTKSSQGRKKKIGLTTVKRTQQKKTAKTRRRNKKRESLRKNNVRGGTNPSETMENFLHTDLKKDRRGGRNIVNTAQLQSHPTPVQKPKKTEGITKKKNEKNPLIKDPHEQDKEEERGGRRKQEVRWESTVDYRKKTRFYETGGKIWGKTEHQQKVRRGKRGSTSLGSRKVEKGCRKRDRRPREFCSHKGGGKKNEATLGKNRGCLFKG